MMPLIQNRTHDTRWPDDFLADHGLDAKKGHSDADYPEFQA